MILRRSGWLARAFFWSLTSRWALASYTSRARAREVRDGAPTDVCEIVRTVFIFLPLRVASAGVVMTFGGIVLTIAVLALASAVDVWLPGLLWGLAFAGAAALGVLTLAALSRCRWRRCLRVITRCRALIEIAEALCAYADGVKSRYCPLVTFEQGPQDRSEGR